MKTRSFVFVGCVLLSLALCAPPAPGQPKGEADSPAGRLVAPLCVQLTHANPRVRYAAREALVAVAAAFDKAVRAALERRIETAKAAGHRGAFERALSRVRNRPSPRSLREDAKGRGVPPILRLLERYDGRAPDCDRLAVLAGLNLTAVDRVFRIFDADRARLDALAEKMRPGAPGGDESGASAREFERLLHRKTTALSTFLSGRRKRIVVAYMFSHTGTWLDATDFYRDQLLRALDNVPEPPPDPGVRLVYRFRTRAARDQARPIIRRRLEKIGISAAAITAPGETDLVLTIDHGAPGRAHIRRTIEQRGAILFAIEAIPEELQDPETGLGPTFDAGAFLDKHRDAPAPIPLYPRSADPTRPGAEGAKPRYCYYPPRPHRDGGAEHALAAAEGAIVLLSGESTFTGEDLAKLYEKRANFEIVLGFEMQPAAKERLRAVTRRNIGRSMCIIINDRFLMKPKVKSQLPGEGIIEGIGDLATIRALIASASVGELDAAPVLVREEIIPVPKPGTAPTPQKR